MTIEMLGTSLACVIGLVSVCHADQRTWKDAKSERTLEAELLTFDGETVALKKADGKTVEVDVERLSKEDQDFILSNPRTGLGISCVDLSDATSVLKRYRVVPPVKDGIQVLDVLPSTPASESGLKVGDIIATVEGKPARRASFGYLDSSKEYEIVAYRPHEKESTAPTKPSRTPTKKTKAPAATTTKITWEKLTFSLRVLPVSRLKEIQELQRATSTLKPGAGHIPVQNMAASLAAWKEWEKQQSQIDIEKRPFELKTDRLGMTLDMFKSKYYRTDHVDNPAPMCSDANPGMDNPMMLYRAEYARAGIVHARTTFPYEEHGPEPNVPSIAAAPTELYVYHFVDGKLYRMTVFFYQKDFDKVIDAVNAKFGEPNAKETRVYQNSFGASFEGEVLLWNNEVSELSVFERAGRTDSSLLILTDKELEKVANDNIKAKIKPRTDDL